MKLPFEILQIELSENLQCEVFGIDHSCDLIKSPILLEPGLTFHPEYCYLTESSKFIEENNAKNQFFIICGDIPEESLTGDNNSIIYFSSPQSIMHIMNLMVNIFAKYRHWEDELKESLEVSGSLDELIQLSMPIFNNPLFLIDSGFNLVAVANLESQANYDLVENQRVDEIWIIKGKECLIHAIDVNEPYFRHLPNDHPRLFININEGNDFIGNLSIQASHRALRKSDAYILTILAGVVKKAMLRFGTADSKRRNLIEKVLLTLLEDQVVDPEVLKQVLSFTGSYPGEEFKILAMKIPKPSGKDYIRYFLQLLSIKLPVIGVSTTGDIASMVLRVSMAEQQKINIISVLEKELNSFGFRVGLSNVFSDLLEIRQYFLQARYALEIGDLNQEANYVLPFSDYRFDFILINCTGDLKPKLLWPEGFKNLIEHDKKGKVSYIETLRAYLYNNHNANQAASALFISRNSFLSRLERMTKLLSVDLNDPKSRFQVELSLFLYDRYKKM